MKYGYDYMIGKHIGKLQIQCKDLSKKRYYVWCLCDCGVRKSIYAYHIKRKKIKSCGCNSMKAFGKNNPTYTGYEDISGSYWRKVQEGAKKRKLTFSITKKYVWNIFLKQKKKCALSGEPLVFDSGFNIRDGNASLDRIDSSKGYIPGNVQWVHKIINKIKGKLSDEEIVKWAEMITKSHPAIKAEVAV